MKRYKIIVPVIAVLLVDSGIRWPSFTIQGGDR
jgi:hypothetical protein